MTQPYPGTDAHFEQYTHLPDLHDPIVLGPGSDGIQTTSQVYSSLAQTFDKAVGDLKAVLATSQHFQQGQAADAARQHVLKVVSAGEAGAEHARLATYALQEQAGYYARARTDMQAAVDKAASGPPVPAHGTKGPSQVAVDSSHAAGLEVAIGGAKLYETNSNHNLTYVFQGFDPPQIAAPEVSAGPQQAAPAWGGGGLGSGGPGLTPVGSASVAHTTAPPTLVGPSSGSAAPSTNVQPPSSSVPTAFVSGAPASGGTGAGSDGRGAVPGTGSGGTPQSRGGARTSPPPPVVPASPGASPIPPASRSVPDLPAGAPTPGGIPSSSLPGGLRPGEPGFGGSRAGGSSSGAGSFPIVNEPLPSNAQTGRGGWVPGQPWTTRPGANLPGTTTGDPFGRASSGLGSESARPVAGEPRSVSGRPSMPGVVEPGPSTGPGSSRASTTGHQPYMPMGGGGGRGQETEHRRPSWLVEPDPEELWMSGLPPHGPAVIEPLED